MERDLDPDSSKIEEEEPSLIEQVALTVDVTDDPSLPVWTFRMWSIGLFTCAFLSFVNQFFNYRSSPLIITAISAQIVALPIGRFMAAVLPTKSFNIPFTTASFSLNPGPFNKKEHVLITIFANSGFAFGNGGAYAVGIVDIIKAFYGRHIKFHTALLLIITTQVLGYGWAGLLRRYLVEPASMWWPGNLVQVSLFRTLHEKEEKKGLSRMNFFLIFMIASFCYYLLPGYLFSTLTSISWVCWIFKNSVTAQQLGSGQQGLGLGAFSLDWATISAYLYSPLVSPWFAIVNTMVGFVLAMYILTPAFYYGNVYNAKTFPIFSSSLFNGTGQEYVVESVVNKQFELDVQAYEQNGPLHLSTFFAMTYGVGFAAVASTITHVLCFHGKEIWQRSRSALKEKPDIHSKLMKKYPGIPDRWFIILTVVSILLSIGTVTGFKKELQLPWWAVIVAAILAFIFTLPIGVIAATTNQTPGINIITEYIAGYMLPGQPIANVCFKTYGYISMTQALSFLQDFKLGHYMKVPPRSMFTVQIVGTTVAAIVNTLVAYWLLDGIPNICNKDKLPASSVWTCPNDKVFFDASVIWGLVGPRRIFGSEGQYKEMTWFFLIGALAPVPVWLLSLAVPRWSSILRLVNMPIILGASGYMPPATSVTFTTWFILGAIFNYFVFRYRKRWWQRYNYVLSAALDAGTAFMAVLIYLALGLENTSMTWWGTNGDNCPLAACPTAHGIVVDGCPVY